MDFNLDIVLPKSLNIKDLGIHENVIQWGEEIDHREPKVYDWRDKLRFQKNTLPTTYEQFLDNKITREKYTILTVKGRSLFELEWAVNNNKDVATDPIVEFIDTVLSDFSGWCLILSLDDEKIEIIEKVNRPLVCSSKLIEGLKWEKPHGVVILNIYK